MAITRRGVVRITPKTKFHAFLPLPLLEHDMAADDVHFLHYDARNLSQFITSRCKKPIFTYLSDSEWAWLFADRTRFNSVWRDKDIWNYLQFWGIIIDKIFFGGILSPYLNLRYDHEDIRTCYGMRTIGNFRPSVEFDDPSYSIPDPRSREVVHAGTVCIHRPEGFSRWNFEREIYLIVGILAHEMLHAFFNTYTCTCERRCRDIMKAPDRLGSHNHGEAWADAMYAIEQRLKTDLWDGIDCNLRGLRTDIIEGGYKPRPEKLQKWGLKHWDVYTSPKKYGLILSQKLPRRIVYPDSARRFLVWLWEVSKTWVTEVAVNRLSEETDASMEDESDAAFKNPG